MRTRNKLLAVLCVVFLVAGVIMGPVTVASAITLNCSSLADIQFEGAGNTFSFLTNTDGYAFKIITESGGNSSLGLMGTITGPFTIGDITSYPFPFPILPLERAPVTGTGMLTIFDADRIPLTATVNWGSIYTFYASGALNTEGLLNMTVIAYSGENPDLKALKSAGQAVNTVTFQFAPSKSLTALTTELTNSTSYSTTITFVPAPATVLLLGSGLVGLGLLRFRRREKKS